MIKYILLILVCSQHVSGQDTFVYIGIHPGVSAQTTSTGKQISALFSWKES